AGPGDTQDTFREAPRCGGGAPEYIVPGGPDAAWAIGDIYCGSLTGDSGGAGRRLRLKFWTQKGSSEARAAPINERTTSSSRGLTAIILRLRWSSRWRSSDRRLPFLVTVCYLRGSAQASAFAVATCLQGTYRTLQQNVTWSGASAPPSRPRRRPPGLSRGRRARPRRERRPAGPRLPARRSCAAPSSP